MLEGGLVKRNGDILWLYVYYRLFFSVRDMEYFQIFVFIQDVGREIKEKGDERERRQRDGINNGR